MKTTLHKITNGLAISVVGLLLGLGIVYKSHAAIVDVVFVLQESNSVILPTSWFDQEVQFTNAVIQNMTVSPSETNVGINLYANNSRIASGLSSNTTVVSNTLNNLSPLGGNACIYCGLLQAYDVLRLTGRPNSQKAVVLFSNGNPTAGESQPANIIAMASTAYNDSNINTFSIVIGSGADFAFLDQLSMAGGGHPAFNVNGFSPFMQEFNAFASAVPIPPALYLFGTGLIGLIGIARKRNAVY